jgi:hypothetical protein
VRFEYSKHHQLLGGGQLLEFLGVGHVVDGQVVHGCAVCGVKDLLDLDLVLFEINPEGSILFS